MSFLGSEIEQIMAASCEKTRKHRDRRPLGPDMLPCIVRNIPPPSHLHGMQATWAHEKVKRDVAAAMRDSAADWRRIDAMDLCVAVSKRDWYSE
jgi:hypothetical protein